MYKEVNNLPPRNAIHFTQLEFIDICKLMQIYILQTQVYLFSYFSPSNPNGITVPIRAWQTTAHGQVICFCT